MSGLAGEFFVAAELLRQGLQTSVTFGNAKSVDLLAYSETLDRTFAVQVKSLRSKNYFLLGLNDIVASQIYVFVLLNSPRGRVQYFVVPGNDMVNEPERFGKYFKIEKMPGIHPSILSAQGYENAWAFFHATLNPKSTNRPHIEHIYLAPEMIPTRDSPLDLIERFALSFDAYSFWGDGGAIDSAAESCCTCLSHLRTRLFLAQRSGRHGDGIDATVAFGLLDSIATAVADNSLSGCVREAAPPEKSG